MSIKHLLIITSVLVCCSPNSIIKDNLIGNWKSSSKIYRLADTITLTDEIKISSNQIKFIITNQFNNTISANDTSEYLNYSKSNDTLIILDSNNNKSYYKYNILNDSLFISYLAGDTIKLNPMAMIIAEKYKKE